MGNNTHTEFRVLPNGARALVTGVKDTCKHRWTESYSVTRSGKLIIWSTFPKWASYTSKLRDRLIWDYQESIGDPVSSGGVACVKCDKCWTPDLF